MCHHKFPHSQHLLAFTKYPKSQGHFNTTYYFLSQDSLNFPCIMENFSTTEKDLIYSYHFTGTQKCDKDEHKIQVNGMGCTIQSLSHLALSENTEKI